MTQRHAVPESREAGHLVEALSQLGEPVTRVRGRLPVRLVDGPEPFLVVAPMLLAGDPGERGDDAENDGRGGRGDREGRRRGREREEGRHRDEGGRASGEPSGLPDALTPLGEENRDLGLRLGHLPVEPDPFELERRTFLVGAGHEPTVLGRESLEPSQLVGDAGAPELLPLALHVGLRRRELFRGAGRRFEEPPRRLAILGREKERGREPPLVRGAPLREPRFVRGERLARGAERLGTCPALGAQPVDRRKARRRKGLGIRRQRRRLGLRGRERLARRLPRGEPPGERPALGLDDGERGELGPCAGRVPAARRRLEPRRGFGRRLTKRGEPRPLRLKDLPLLPEARDLGLDRDRRARPRVRHLPPNGLEKRERANDRGLAPSRVGDPRQLDGEGGVETVAVEDVLGDVGRGPEERLGEPSRHALAEDVPPLRTEKLPRRLDPPVAVDDTEGPLLEIAVDGPAAIAGREIESDAKGRSAVRATKVAKALRSPPAARQPVEGGDDRLAERRLPALVPVEDEKELPFGPVEIDTGEGAESRDPDPLDPHPRSGSGGRTDRPASASRPRRRARSTTRLEASSGAADRRAARSA